MIVPSSVKALFPGAKAAANVRQVEAGLETYGYEAGLLKPHRLAQYLAQLAHESVGFVHDREIWGPTAAQERYDVRTDLGNTPARDGDGKKYMGRTTIQLTGKGNVQRFQAWCAKNGLNPPDFVATPDLLNTDPWEGLVPIWYWSEGNPTGKSLNALADANNIEQITKRINGGLNGYADRLRWYDRIALAMTGFDDLRRFQTEAGIAGFYDGEIDGDNGPLTRAALHKWLARGADTPVSAGPIVEKKEVVPETVEKQVDKKFSLFGWLFGLVSGGGLGVAGFAGMAWQSILALGAVALVLLVVALLLRNQIVAAVKDIRGAVENA